MILERSFILLAAAAVVCAATLASGDGPLRLAALAVTAACAVSVASAADPRLVPPLAVTCADGLCALGLAALLGCTTLKAWLSCAAAAQVVLAALDGVTVLIDDRHLPLYFRAANLMHGVLVLALVGGVGAAFWRRASVKATLLATPAD